MNSQELNTSNLRHLMEYYARKFATTERMVQDMLPGWIGRAHSLRLKVVLRSYHTMVKKQVRKWEVFFAEENIRLDGTAGNRPIEEFLQDTQTKLQQCASAEERDAWLLASAQAINRFMMNMYEMASGFARSLGLEHAAQAFEDAVINERFVYEDLCRLALHDINLKLAEPVHIPG